MRYKQTHRATTMRFATRTDHDMKKKSIVDMISAMSPSDIYLEMERERIPEKDLMIGHLVVKAAEDHEEVNSAGTGYSKISGFLFSRRKFGLMPVVRHPYAERPKGLIEAAINHCFPDHRHIFSTSVVYDDGDSITRGIHANDALNHPHVVACLGLSDDRVDALMSVRLSALRMVEVPEPSDETIHVMRKAIMHRTPEFLTIFKDRMPWLNSLAMYAGHAPIPDPLSLARISFCSDEESLTEMEVDALSQRRLYFINRHPGSESIFAPFPESDAVLSHIRKVVDKSESPKKVDDIIRMSIGSRLWSDFSENPSAFCEARVVRRHHETRHEIDDPEP